MLFENSEKECKKPLCFCQRLSFLTSVLPPRAGQNGKSLPPSRVAFFTSLPQPPLPETKSYHHACWVKRYLLLWGKGFTSFTSLPTLGETKVYHQPCWVKRYLQPFR